MKAFEKRMIKRMGYTAAAEMGVKPECLDSDPCVMCGATPTVRTRLVAFRELRSLGFPIEWIDDDRFFVHLCRLCHLLWQQRNIAWRREWGREHGVTPRAAERRREGAYLDLIEKLGEEIRRAQEIKTEYGERIVGIEVAVNDPFSGGIVSYIDATHLKQGSVTVFVVQDDE